MPWTKELAKKIDSFLELEHDWDSYGARPVSYKAMMMAKFFTEGLFIEPTSEGGINISLGDEDVFILIHPDGTWETGCVNDDGFSGG